MNNRLILPTLLLTFLASNAGSATNEKRLPPGFVDAARVIPGLVLDIRYATSDNFIGSVVDGYEKPKCYLQEKAANILARVQRELASSGLSLKMYDCYRPIRAVNHFVRWAGNSADQKRKAEFYPNMDKSRFLPEGYLSATSLHSSGWEVDLTIVSLPGLIPLDMGTEFDHFDVSVNTLHPSLAPQQRANRLLLKTLLEKHGFENTPEEWWEYAFRERPRPAVRYDFPVR